MYSVSEIEDAILATLQSDGTLSSYVRLFTPINLLTEKSIKEIITATPAIGVMSAGGNYDYRMSNLTQDTGIFTILCINKNLRTKVASLHGSEDGEKGAWSMLEDCRLALVDSKLGLSIIDCLPIRRRIVLATETWAIVSLEVEIKWRTS
jgi:phage gp37-like protein